jgi:hypothetical protein
LADEFDGTNELPPLFEQPAKPIIEKAKTIAARN